MGVDKKIGISKKQRDIADKYARRYSMVYHKLIVSRPKRVRTIYLICEDIHGLEYRIRWDKVVRMNRPKGIQVTNKAFYLKYQCDKVHGKDLYDLSMISDDMINSTDKLPIICKVHGVFHKRKASLITDREGCPSCSQNRYNNNRKYESRTNFR